MKAMQSVPNMPVLTDIDLNQTDPRLLEALARLNQIGAAINRFSSVTTLPAKSSTTAQVAATLSRIVESAIKVVPDASAVIYVYDQANHDFDITSRVSAGEPDTFIDDVPRPNGIGMRAIQARRRVLSYEHPDLHIHPAKVAMGAESMACFPLVVADQVGGVLYVYLHEARAFSQFELLMLDNFVNQAAMAIYQARRLASVQRDLCRKEEELSRLRRAGLLISSRLGLDETLEAILQMALDVTGAHYGIFRLLDASGRNLLTRAVAGEHEGRLHIEALPIDAHSIMGWVAEHRQPLCIHDLYAAPWPHVYYPLHADLRMRSELAVPLIGSGGRLEGVLNLESPIVGAFSEEDRLLLQSLATQAVIAIQEARLLDALLEIGRLVLVEPCQAVLTHVVSIGCDLLNVAVGVIWCVEGDTLVLQSASAGYTGARNLPLEGSLAGEAIRWVHSVISEDVRIDARFHQRDLAQEQRWGRALVVPLLSSDHREPIGAFSVYSKLDMPGHLTDSEWEEKVLICLAHYAALALHNAERQQALRRAQERHAIAETFAAVGDIAANVLHHLNNKVGTIPVRIQGIQDKCGHALLNDEYLSNNLMEIERSAREAMETVRENLTHLRPIHLVPTSVAACVKAALDVVHLPDEVTVQVRALDSLPDVLAGQRSLTWVFANLLENALAAMQGGGEVVIEGMVCGAWVEVKVRDDGPGIAPELQKHIFEFNVHKPRRKLGFGLWWIKTLVVRLGGTIVVDSDGQHGTQFRLRLPCAEDA